MIAAFNAMAECLMTAVFTCAILYALARLGLMPMIVISEEEAKSLEGDDE